MGYAQFVGRVGALAVALGVTNVVGHPLVAWAEEPSAGSSSTGGAEPAPSTGTPDKPAETQSADPTTAPSHEPADTEEDAPEPEAPDVEETQTEETEVSEVETPDPTTPPAPETEEAQAPEPDPTTVEVPETKDPHPSEVEQAATPPADDNDDADQSRFVARALTVSGIDEQSLDAPLPIALAIPVSADLVTSSAAPTAAVTITKVDPVTVEETHPFRSLVLGFLGIFGFDPTPGATNDALLASLWAAYRGYERRFENESPTVSGATVLSTSQTENGYTAVTISVGFTDPDGDTLHFTTTNGHAGTLTANGDGTYTYLTNTPGTDTVTITANDDDGTGHLHGLLGWLFKPDAGHTRTVTLTLNVTAPTNGAPVAGDDTATTDEDTPVTIHVLTNDTDPDNDALSITTHTTTAHGTVTLNADGTFTYAPNENYYGTDEFTYSVTDGTTTSNTATVTITVNPINDAPVAHDATVHNVSENSTTSATLANLVTDIDGDTLTLEVVNQPELGTVTFVTATGFFYYAPAEVGTATSTTFTYRAFDGTDYSNTATVTIEFANTNTAPPVADDPAYTISNVDPVTGKVFGTLHVTDADTPALSYSIGQSVDPAVGQVVLVSNGFTFTPTGAARLAAYTGSGPTGVTFTVAVSDGQNTITVPVSIAIKPAIAAVTATVTADSYLSGIALNADGSRIYLSKFNGEIVTVLDATTLTVIDGRPQVPGVNPISVGPNPTDSIVIGNYLYVTNTGSNAGNGTVSVVDTTTGNEVDLLIVGQGPRWLTLDGNRLYVSNFHDNSLSVIDVTTNTVIDTDPVAPGVNPISLTGTATGIAAAGGRIYATNQTTGTVTVFDASTFAVIGSLTAGADPYDVVAAGNLVYVSNFSSNTISVIDAATNTKVTPDITVGNAPTNLALHGNRLFVSNFADNTVSIIDIPTHAVIETVKVGQLPGPIAVSPDGDTAYVLNADSTMSVITIIAPVSTNHAPVASNDTIHLSTNSSISANLANSSSDADGDALTGILVSDASHGVLNFLPNRTFTYSPAAGFVGTDSFNYKVNDGALDSNIATVTIVVTAVNRAPTAVDDAITVDEDSLTTVIDVRANDSDPDGNVLTVSAVGALDHGGTAVIGSNGTIAYTPAENFNGTETFTYTISDGALTDTATVTVTVNPVGDPPVIQSIVSTQQSATSWIVTVTAYDPDGDPLDITLTAADPTKVSITPIVANASARMFNIAAFDAGPEPTTADYLVEITDPAWALANPGAPLGIAAGVTDGNSAPVTQDAAAGRVTNLIGVGFDYIPHLDIPAAPDGLYYTKAAVSLTDVVLLLSDGTAVLYGHTYGDGDLPNPEIPDLPDGLTYTDVAVWDSYKTLLLRSDGVVVPLAVDPGFGSPVEIPDLPAGTSYTGVAGTGFNGDGYAVLLRSDGTAAVLKTGIEGATELPAAGNGLTYTQVSAGPAHLVLLRSDGTAVAFAAPGPGSPNTYGELDIPALPGGLTYTQVAAGNQFTLLLRSDGTVMAVGRDESGQIDVPPLPPGLTYTTIAAGNQHAVLLRSDGAALGLGSNSYGQTAIPALPAGTTYTQVYAGLENTFLATAKATGLLAGPDQATVNEDAQVSIAVLANDTDPQGNPLSITNVTPGSHGSTTINADGTITYTPAADYYGSDTFAYTLSNGVTSSVAGVTVKVISQPDAPRAQDAEYDVAAGAVLYIDMAGKVYDPPDPWVFPFNGRVQLEIASQPSLGSASFSQLTYLTYTAPADLEGATSTTFTYYGNDGLLHGNVATVTINFV